MLKYWDQNAGGICSTPNTGVLLTSLIIERSTGFEFDLQFYQDQVAIDASAYLVGCVVKEVGQFDGDSLIPAVTFIWDAGRMLWTGKINFNTTALNTLLFVDGDPTNDVKDVNLTIAFGYSSDDGATWTPSNNIALELLNNAFRGTEGTPLGLTDPLDWISTNSFRYLQGVTGYTGGGSTNLDGVVTASLAVPKLFVMVHPTDGLRFYLLRAGTDAASGINIIHPTDYNASTNAKVFILQG